MAQQQAERARYLVLKAQEEKKRTIIYAEGEKESARMIGDAIKAEVKVAICMSRGESWICGAAKDLSG